MKGLLLTSHRGPEPREALGSRRFLEDHRHLRLDCVMHVLLTRHDALQVALEGNSHARQAEWHANVDVRWALATPHARRPEGLLRCGPVEPWDVDADAQPSILAWMGSCAR